MPVTQACRLATVWLDREVVYDYSSGSDKCLAQKKKFWAIVRNNRGCSGTKSSLQHQGLLSAC